MTRWKILAVTVLVASTAGCTSIEKIGKGRVTIDGAYTVESPTQWASVSAPTGHIWTVDGPLLQQIRFVTKIEDGQAMFKGRSASKMPKFHGTMNALEVVELFQASFSTIQVQSLKTSNLRPAPFGGKPGFRFEFSFLTKDGLAMNGLAGGAIVDKKLYMILYYGTKLYYFDKERRDAEAVIDSVNFI